LHSNEFKVLCRNYDVTVEPSRLKFNVFSQFYLLCLSSLWLSLFLYLYLYFCMYWTTFVVN